MATTPLRLRMNEAMAVARDYGHTLSSVEEHWPERGRILTASCRVCGGGVIAEWSAWRFVFNGNATRRKCAAILASKRRAAQLRAERKRAGATHGR